MKKIVLIYSLLIYGIFHSQIISGKIFSDENNQPIAFARIGIINESIGSVTDENGNYKIDLSNIDTSKEITVQLGGYVSFVQKIQDFIKLNSHNIILKEKVNEIAEVKISPKTFENKNWGVNSKSKKMGFWYTSKGNADDNWLNELAILFQNKKRVKIEKININVAQFETEKPVVLNFNIYSNENKRPGKSILSENLSVEITKEKIIDGTFTYDLSDKSIWIDKEDFYISMQIMDGFKGKLGFSAALLSTVYLRSYYEKWEKIPVGRPAINIDVKIEKEKRRKK